MSRWTDERGFTLLEVVVVMAIMGILSGIAVLGFSAYTAASDEAGSAADLVSALRNGAERSLSEGRTYCLQIDDTAGQWSLYRHACGTGTMVEGPISVQSPSDRVAVAAGQFGAVAGEQYNTCPLSPPAGACAYFYPRGTAAGGTVTVTRSGSPKTYTISVDPLTARVSQT